MSLSLPHSQGLLGIWNTTQQLAMLILKNLKILQLVTPSQKSQNFVERKVVKISLFQPDCTVLSFLVYPFSKPGHHRTLVEPSIAMVASIPGGAQYTNVQRYMTCVQKYNYVHIRVCMYIYILLYIYKSTLFCCYHY